MCSRSLGAKPNTRRSQHVARVGSPAEGRRTKIAYRLDAAPHFRHIKRVYVHAQRNLDEFATLWTNAPDRWSERPSCG